MWFVDGYALSSETFSVRKKMAAIKFEINPGKKLRFEEGFGWVIFPLK
jgi:hypothetical protein